MTRQPAIQVGIFLPVATNTELHFKPHAFDSVHAGNITMAGIAKDGLFNVALVVEHHMLRQVIDLDPGNRGLGVEIMMFLFNLRMARQ